MKERNKIFLYSILFISFLFTRNVYAKPLEEEIKPIVKGKCIAGGENYARAEDRYHPKIYLPSHFPSHGDGDYFNVSVDRGSFDIYIYELIDGTSHKEQPLYKFKLLGGQGRQIHFSLSNEPKDLAILFVLNKSDNICNVGTNSVPVQDNKNGTWSTADDNGFIYYYYLGLPSIPSEIDIPNINYDGVCASFRNGNYDSFANLYSSVGLGKKDFDLYRNKISFPYCSRPRVRYNYSKKETATIIKKMIQSFNINSKFVSQPLSHIEEGAQIIKENKPQNSLTCPAYQNKNGIVIPNQDYTTKKYYKVDTFNENLNIYSSKPGIDGVCSVTCEENLTVSYGPPVASKAGLCFEYKVKVESKVNCNSKFTVPEPNPDSYKVCTPVGSCNGGTYHSASGPNEEFDTCVNDCDNGKYSQKCIDKCYNKVYDNGLKLPSYEKKVIAKTRPKTDYNNKRISELTDAELNYYNSVLASGPNKVGPGKKYSVDELKIALTEAGTGYYYVSGGETLWNKGLKRYWELPGRYYPLNISRYAITRLQDAGRCNSTNFAGYGKQCGISLIDTNIGILRNNSGRGYCGAACSWYGCDTAKSNNYYRGYPRHHGKASNRSFLNIQDAIDVYLDDFDSYLDAAHKCLSKSKCSTENATYTIKINNKTNSNPDQDNWIDYVSVIKENSVPKTTVNGDNINTSIFLDKKYCYFENKDPNTIRYLSEWSFPGTWINNKTGKISYNVPSNDNSWHQKKEKFCTNLDSKDVNTKWWVDRVVHPNDNITNLANIDEYNIKASVNDFGFYHWGFNIDCFYALNDAYDSEGKGDVKNNNKLDYKIRNVELNDLFPDNKEEKEHDSDETGRTPGFNWSSGATNVKNDEYPIAPEPLYEAIQSRGNKIYADRDKYLDYEIILKPKDLNYIRNYSNNLDNNYSKFGGDIKVDNGVAYYVSDLLRNSGLSVTHLGASGVNNQDGQSNNEETFTNDYVNQLIKERKKFINSLNSGKK